MRGIVLSLIVAALALAAQYVLAASILVKGDSLAGNTGFQTNYTFMSRVCGLNTHTGKTDPYLHRSGEESFKDHTTGDGSMFFGSAAGCGRGAAGALLRAGRRRLAGLR